MTNTFDIINGSEFMTGDHPNVKNGEVTLTFKENWFLGKGRATVGPSPKECDYLGFISGKGVTLRGVMCTNYGGPIEGGLYIECDDTGASSSSGNANSGSEAQNTNSMAAARPSRGRAVDPDRECFAADAGAGLTDKNAHYVWAQGQDSATLESNLKTKAAYLFRCPSMTSDRLSAAFADISVIVARYVPNAKCFGGDAGAVSSDWLGHRTWSQSKGAEATLTNLQNKISSALRCMDRPRQNSFFADVSVAIAKAGS
jgi:hypothetical protein